jgi:hypothetical protein
MLLSILNSECRDVVDTVQNLWFRVTGGHDRTTIVRLFEDRDQQDQMEGRHKPADAGGMKSLNNLRGSDRMRETNLGSILGGYSKFLIYSWTPNAGHHPHRQLNWMMALKSGRQSKLNDPCVRDTATVEFPATGAPATTPRVQTTG